MKRYYPLTQLLAVAGAFVVVTTFAFGAAAATSIDFAISIGAVLVGLAIARGVNAGVGIATSLVGAWSILVTAGIFSGATQRWLDFAAGTAFAAAGLDELFRGWLGGVGDQAAGGAVELVVEPDAGGEGEQA